MRIAHSKHYNKERKKRVEKEIDSILKESSMTRKEFNEIKGVTLEMKASEQIDMLEETSTIVLGPSEGVTIAQPCVQAPIALYAAVTPVKLVTSRSDQPKI